MAKFTFYCQVDRDHLARGIKTGVYTYGSEYNHLGWPRAAGAHLLVQYSNKVWRQGPRGGVKIVKDRGHGHSYGYVTTNEDMMKEFVWVKLQARAV